MVNDTEKVKVCKYEIKDCGAFGQADIRRFY
jgi:hypothetical protein